MRVEVNDLESRRFGVSFARVEEAAGTADELARVLRLADADGLDVISARIDATDLSRVRMLEDHGFRIMDTLVYHRVALPVAASTAPAANRVTELTGEDAAACAALALRAFHGYPGHYHADPRLSDNAADAAYADWISRLLTDPAEGQLALGVKYGSEVAGFIAGKRNGAGASEIVLNAVDPGSQRKGLYTALLRAYLNRRSEQGDREVVISTQLQNFAVQRAWSRAGFTLYQSFHTLHRWRPEA